MKTYWEVALEDLEEAEFNLLHKHYRSAVFYLQQFAEKGAKALLEKKDPGHRDMRSHAVENVLIAYDEGHKVSDTADKARYLTGFYFNSRYPGDNYADITEAQAQKAHRLALELRGYYESELVKLKEIAASVKIDLEGLSKLIRR